MWSVRGSTIGLATAQFGGVGWRAAPGDYDGDGIVDPAAYRRANGVWRYLASSTGTKISLPTLGGGGQTPVVGLRP